MKRLQLFLLLIGVNYYYQLNIIAEQTEQTCNDDIDWIKYIYFIQHIYGK